MVKVFISYSNADRGLAGRLKSNLESEYGMHVFLAHEDIEPNAEWVPVILKELKDCDIFLPLISESFKASEWTDQETGYALAKEKVLIRLKIDLDPYGFIKDKQAMKVNSEKVDDVSRAIAEIASKAPSVSRAFRDGLIEHFGKSISFADANRASKILLEFVPYEPEQLRRLLEVTVGNNQIYQAWDARRAVARVVNQSRYKDELPEDLLKEFDALRRSKAW